MRAIAGRAIWLVGAVAGLLGATLYDAGNWLVDAAELVAGRDLRIGVDR